MLTYDDPAFSQPADPRTQLLIDLLSRSIYFENQIAATLESAGLKPGDYELKPAKVTWTTVVPDAARLGKLRALVAAVSELQPAFEHVLEQKVSQLLQPVAAGGCWYRHDDPYECWFVGLRSSRAVIDRGGLRSGLRELAAGQYRVLVVHGQPGSGKSHSWLLVDHLRNAGKLVGANRFTLVTTHDFSGEVTGEVIAQSLMFKLGLTFDLAPSGELDDARVRKYLWSLVGMYPPDDGTTRWIILDGLDRPLVNDGARDLARGLIQLVERGELPRTRLIITGLDPLGLNLGYAVRTEKIPAIDRELLHAFLKGVAKHLGRTTSDGELEEWIAEIVGPGPQARDLSQVEKRVVGLVRNRWVGGPDRDD